MTTRNVAVAATEGPPIESGRLSTRDGVGLYYAIHGRGPDAVLVPYAAALAPALADLGRRRTVIFYDMRSRGRSDPIADLSRVGIERDIDDLEDVRVHFGLARVSLIGFSYLAAVVATYASRWPGHVDHLVFLGGVGPRAAGGSGPDLSRLDSARLARLRASYPAAAEQDPEAYCREFWATYLPLYVGGMDRPTEAASRILGGLCELPNERPTASLKLLQRISEDGQALDLRAIGAAIRAPTLILHGDADHAAPLANARAWLEVIAGARLEIVPRAGHSLWAEAKPEVLDHLDRFLPPAPAR